MSRGAADGNGQIDLQENSGTGAGFLRCLGLFNKAVTVALAFLAVLSGASSAASDWPVGPIAEAALAALAAGLIGFHLLNFEVRGILGHRDIPGIEKMLWAEWALGCGVPAAILLAIFHAPPTWELLGAICAGFALVYGFYEPVQEKIRREVAEADLLQGTAYFGLMRPLRFLGIPDEIREIAQQQHGPNLQSLLAFFVGDPWLAALSRTRTVVLCVMLAGLITAGVAAADVGIQQGVRDPSQESQESQDETGQTSERPSGQSEQGASASGAESGSGATQPDGGCDRLPGDGAPSWAEAELNELYLGGLVNVTPPPGLKEGGCTTRVIVPPREDGTFVYVVGKNPAGEIRSLAVVSTEFEPAIFLAPASQQVLELIEEGQMPIGGYPRVEDLAGGDMAPVLTPEGTVVLVRSSTHPPGKSRYATPYVELPPTVASAFVEVMHEFGAWFWPLAPVAVGDAEVFPLVGRSQGEEVRETVVLDPATGIARRGSHTYLPPEAQLSQQELEHRAAGAWRGPPAR